MIKNLLLSCLLFISSLISFSQKKELLNEFKYAVVLPSQNDPYGIDARGKLGLKSAGIVLLDFSNQHDWPDDTRTEPCSIIFIEFLEGRLPNALNCGSLRILGTDCKGQIVFDERERAKNAMCNPPYDCCWRKWANAAESFFENLNYRYEPQKNMRRTTFPKVEQLQETEESFRTYSTVTKTDFVEGIYKSYQNELLPKYKLIIKKFEDKYKVIILETENAVWKHGEVKAYLEPTSVPGSMSVNWFDEGKISSETFGQIDANGILHIELYDAHNKQKIEYKFIKTFPVQSRLPIENNTPTKATGSGFFISGDGYLATNNHVISGAKNISISVVNDLGTTKYSAKVAIADAQNDVAILQITDPTFKNLINIPYSINELGETGERVFTIGYPLHSIMGDNFKVADGIISAKSGIADDIRYYQISVPIQPGNSGGPLFNKNGSIIGLTTSQLSSKAVGRPIENVNYAIKSSYLLVLWNMLPGKKVVSDGKLLQGKELKDQVAVLKNYVCLIEVTL